ncbi:spry domain-containing socs box protein [Anaeramoeba flamelloides]|uniref:Spry domain-containing socs box protein n=1 Tax=Anaeramoeba flamelloides TaxID=1746091 RepID=A0ABQ8ZBL2_9EUKA|nr:spry domain-containing socs box protein [Anaeramoeba flamelloides]
MNYPIENKTETIYPIGVIVNDPKPLTQHCSIHNKPTKFYCKKEGKLVCSKCFYESCSFHRDQVIKIEEIGKVMVPTKEKRERHIQDIQNKIKAKESKLKKLYLSKKENKKESLELVEQLNDKMNLLLNSLNEVFKCNREFVHDYHNEKKKKLLEKIEEEKENLQKLKEMRKYSASLELSLKNNSFQEVIEFQKLVEEKEIEISKMQKKEHIPNLDQTFQQFYQLTDLDQLIKDLQKIRFYNRVCPSNCVFILKTTNVCLTENVEIEIFIKDEMGNFVNSMIPLSVQIIAQDSDQSQITITKFVPSLKKNQLIYKAKYKPLQEMVLNMKEMIINSESIKIARKKCIVRKKSIVGVFDKNRKDPELLLSDNKTVRHNGKTGQWKSVWGDTEYTKGEHSIYFHIQLFANVRFGGTAIAIGITESIDTDQLGFRQNESFSYYTRLVLTGKDSRLYHKKKFTSYGKPFGEGDVVGVHLNMDKKTLSFSKNEENYGAVSGVLPKKVKIAVHMFRPGDQIYMYEK